MTDRKTWAYEETWLVDFATKLFPFFVFLFFFFFFVSTSLSLSPSLFLSSDLNKYPNATLGCIIAILPARRRNRQVTDRISTIPDFIRGGLMIGPEIVARFYGQGSSSRLRKKAQDCMGRRQSFSKEVRAGDQGFWGLLGLLFRRARA